MISDDETLLPGATHVGVKGFATIDQVGAGRWALGAAAGACLAAL